MNIVGVIPARYASTRFPGKLLAPLAGRPLILHALDRAREAATVGRVIVATDDERIASVVREAGGEVAMTSPDCASGSDRVAEVARDQDWEVVVNLQGDEPNVSPAVIDAVVNALLQDATVDVSTAMVPIRSQEDFLSPHNVKAVAGAQGRALYFSRAPVPSVERLSPAEASDPSFIWGWKHLGLYAFRTPMLLRYATLAPTPLEQREALEQLRLLENGIPIRIVEVDHDSVGVDTPEELERLNQALSPSAPASPSARANE